MRATPLKLFPNGSTISLTDVAACGSCFAEVTGDVPQISRVLHVSNPWADVWVLADGMRREFLIRESERYTCPACD